MSSSKPLIDKANDIADHLDNMVKKLDVDVFSGTSTDDLKETIAKLRHMVDNGDTMMTSANDILSQAKTGRARSESSSTTSRSVTISPLSSPI